MEENNVYTQPIKINSN